MSFQGINEDVSKIRKQIQRVETEIRMVNDISSNTDDKFVQVMTKFRNECQGQVENVLNLYSKIVKELKDMAVLYGEKENVIIQDPGDFFAFVFTFLNDYDDVREKNK